MHTDGSRPRSPWFDIWVRPRRALQTVLRGYPAHWSFSVLTLSFVTNGLFNSIPEAEEFGETFAVWLALVLISGVLGSVVYLFLNSWVLAWTGRWLGGTASAARIRTMLAVPQLIMLWFAPIGIVVALLQLAGVLPFTDAELEQASILSPALLTLLGLDVLWGVLAVWVVVAHTICLSEVQGISIGNAIANQVAAFLVVVFPPVVLLLALG